MAELRPIGPYRVDKRLAAGGMAEVFVAWRSGPHGFTKRVALKRILPQYATDPEFVAMFIEEARIAARFEHPNIVQVFDFGEADKELFLAMELVDGSNINRLLRATARREDPAPLSVTLHVIAQAAHALDYVHRLPDPERGPLRLVHRDVSPANLLLTRTGHVKLADFGIATAAERSRSTDDGQVRGKLGYMSPEQVMGKPLDDRSDVFTLTTILAELLVLEPLFGTGSELDILLRIRDVDLGVLSRTNRRIPRDVMRLLEAGLARSPTERISAGGLAAACEEVMRRRAFAHASTELARLLQRFELVSGEDPGAFEPGARVTAFFETDSLVPATRPDRESMDATSPALYSIRLSDGTVIGPLSFPKLVEMITSGEISGTTEISKAGSRFAPATELPELTRFVTSPAFQWPIEELSRADRHGSVGAARLLPVFFEIVDRRETGVLHLWDGVRRKKVYFVEGKPEFVASTDRRELLGEYLVAEGLCLRMEIEMALALLPRFGGRLGDALVGLGMLRPVQLFRAIADQVRERLLEAFRWRRGQYAFVPGVRSHEETFPLGHDPFELLRDAALQTHPDELEPALAPIHESVIEPTPNPPATLSHFRLPPHWERLIQQVDGRGTVGSILARETTSSGGADAEAVYRALFFGLSCRFIRCVP